MASLPPSPHQQSAQGSKNLSEKISPSILLTAAILATIFFTCVLIHLIVKYFLKSFNREAEEIGSATAFQGQLQQLFHLHDAGVDQSFIDTLPVFLYKAIIGLDDPFDCVVCLCEFKADDKLRLLPKCSHAFHIECIDAWLLSHSTCPLCRRSLLPDLSPSHSPMVLLLESSSVSSARDVPSLRRDSEVLEEEEEESFHKEGEIGVEEDLGLPSSEAAEAKVFPVKLGKFRNAESDDGGEGTGCGNGDLNEMRCFSMGAYEYVMNERSVLQVAIKPLKSRCHSMREVATRSSGFIRESGHDSARIGYECHKKESFSISKIWMRSRKDQRAAHEDCSRRALSFRLPTKNNILGKRTAADQFDLAGSIKAEVGSDLEDGGFSHKVCSRADEAPSFARRTMLWIARRQKSKVVNHG